MVGKVRLMDMLLANLVQAVFRAWLLGDRLPNHVLRQAEDERRPLRRFLLTELDPKKAARERETGAK